jgi:hypothetical protein
MTRVLVVAVALLVALGAGWLWGSAGRWEAGRKVQAAELRSDLVDARGSALAARVDLYNVNFGDASRHLEEAKVPLRRATERLRGSGQTDVATRLDPAIAKIDEAQRLAGRLDQGANARAAEGIKTIDDVLATVASP